MNYTQFVFVCLFVCFLFCFFACTHEKSQVVLHLPFSTSLLPPLSRPLRKLTALGYAYGQMPPAGCSNAAPYDRM